MLDKSERSSRRLSGAGNHLRTSGHRGLNRERRRCQTVNREWCWVQPFTIHRDTPRRLELLKGRFLGFSVRFWTAASPGSP
jgi:hypothetical protein